MNSPKIIWVKDVEEIGQHWSKAWVSSNPDPDSIDPTDVQLITDSNVTIDQSKVLIDLRAKIESLERLLTATRINNAALKNRAAYLEKTCKEMTDAMSNPNNRQLNFGIVGSHDAP